MKTIHAAPAMSMLAPSARQTHATSRGDGAESENQDSARHHCIGRPAGASSLHDQRTQHCSQAEATEQQPVTKGLRLTQWATEGSSARSALAKNMPTPDRSKTVRTAGE